VRAGLDGGFEEIVGTQAAADFTRRASVEGALLKSHRTGDVSRVADGAAPGGTCIRKRYWYPSVADRLRGIFRTTALARSRVEGEARALEQFARLHLQPRLFLAFGERRRAGLLIDSFLCMHEHASVPLDQHLAAVAGSEAGSEIVAGLAAFVTAWHGAGFVDRDLHLRNFLVGGDGRLAKIDSPFARRVARPWVERLQRRELAALQGEILDLGGAELESAFRRAAGAGECRG
jgi:hypothetical protein